MYFGIDLGTTNSLIGYNPDNYLSDLVPSCVDMSTGKCGKDLYEDMKAVRSFKIDMSMGTEGILPRAASRYVLAELARTAKRETGNEVKDVVISVPAYFSDSQRNATIQAATDAGLDVKGLVNEPTAAAIYIAKEKKGLFVVYDLGGGTFDCSIIDSRFGAYDVQATSGQVVGGDNFDKNIMRFLIKNANIPIHHLNKEQKMLLQHIATKCKIKMQQEKKTFIFDASKFGGAKCEFTPEAYVSIMKLTFSSTIECMKSLVSQWIPSTEVFEILLVGGSTFCPYLRQWIEESFGMRTAPITYDPNKVVAQGAALYAEMLERDEIKLLVSDVTKTLSIEMKDGTASVIVPSNSKIPLTQERVFTNPETADGIHINLYQGDSMFVADNECIGTLDWDYGRTVEAGQGEIIVTVAIDFDGTISLSAHELLKEPKVIVLRRRNKE